MPKVGTCTHISMFLFFSIYSHSTQSLSVLVSSTSAHPIRWDYRKTLNDRIVRMTRWDVDSLDVRISDDHLKSARKTWNAHINNKWFSNANWWCMISCFFLIMMESVININDHDDAVICSVIIIVCIAYKFWNCYVVAELHWRWSHSRMHIQEISVLLFIQSINHNTSRLAISIRCDHRLLEQRNFHAKITIENGLNHLLNHRESRHGQQRFYP